MNTDLTETTAAQENMSPAHLDVYQRALEVIPWATQTNAKRYDNDPIASRPPFIKKAKGCRMWDLDGKEYIDYRAALGPITLGYAYDEVDEAVRRQIADGVLFSMASPLELEAAEEILKTIGWAEKIRFMKTGNDANACCLRLARSKTGREHMLTSGYHGYADWFSLGWPKPGIPGSLNDFVHEVEYGDIAAVDRVFDQFGPQMAAAQVVPVEWGQKTNRAYLQRIRERCDEFGTALIFDEVLTGFRVANGGAPEFFDIIPDFSAYAKGISNGYSLAAYAGKAEWMDALDETIITTTYAGDVLCLAAGIAVMKIYQREQIPQHMEAMGIRLVDGLHRLFVEHGIPACANGLPHASVIHFTENEETSQQLRTRLFTGLYDRGIFANQQWFTSFSHQASDIDETLDKFQDTLRHL